MTDPSIVELVVAGFGVLFVGIGLALVNKGRTLRNRGERIAETETTAVGDLRPGRTRIEGTARPVEADSLVEAPLSSVDALATYVSVEANRTSASGNETVYEECDAVPFLVDDGTGQVRVDPGREGFDFERERRTVGLDEEPPEAIRQFLAGKNIDERGPAEAQGSEIRVYNEGLLTPGEDVFVFGDVREADAGWDQCDYVVDAESTDGEFVLSDRSADHQVGKRSQYGSLLYVIGGFSAAFGTLFAGVVLLVGL